MEYKTRIRLIKLIINLLGCITMLAMFLYMMPITVSFETNEYSMSLIARLFTIAMISYYLFLTSLIKALDKYNKIEDLESYRDHIKEMIDLLHTLGKGNTLIEILMLFFAAVIITYAIWWWNSDIYLIEATLEYILLVICTTINTALIIKYANSFNYFNKRLYDEVYK